MNTINIDLTEDTLQAIKEVVKDEIAEAINAFGVAQRQSVRFLSSSKAAQLLEISKPTLNRFRRDGFVAGKRVGNTFYYSEAEIEAATHLGLKYKRKV